MSVSDAAQPGSVRKAQFAVVPMWAHRRIIATRTRTMALAVYVELVGQYAGSTRDAEGLRVWPEVQQIADSMGVPKSSVERALKVLIDCGVVLKKRTVRRNQYWLPQEDPDAFVRTLAAFQSVTSDGPRQQSVTTDVLDSIQSVTTDAPETVTADGPQSVTTDGLYNPDPSIQTQETHLSLAPVVAKAEDARARASEERETFAPPNNKPTTPTADAADRIITAYTTILGRPLLTRTRNALRQQAAEALAAGYPEDWLTDRARELAVHGWTDFAKHVEKSTAPLPGAEPTTAATSGRPPWCGECGNGMPARLNIRFRRRQDGTLCHCHPDAARQPLPGTDTTVSGWLALASQDRPSTTDLRVQSALALGRQMQAEHNATRNGWQPYREPTAEERAADLGHF